MEFNFLPIIVSTFVTLLIGFAWYHPKAFGTIWMKETGMTEEKAQQGNMMKIFGLTIVYSFIISFMLSGMVIHQYSVVGLIGGPDKIATALPSYAAFMEDYGNVHRGYSHGSLHGFIAGLLFVLPISAINGLFEQKSWRYILITAGYWIVSLTIMGAIICGWK